MMRAKNVVRLNTRRSVKVGGVVMLNRKQQPKDKPVVTPIQTDAMKVDESKKADDDANAKALAEAKAAEASANA